MEALRGMGHRILLTKAGLPGCALGITVGGLLLGYTIAWYYHSQNGQSTAAFDLARILELSATVIAFALNAGHVIMLILFFAWRVANTDVDRYVFFIYIPLVYQGIGAITAQIFVLIQAFNMYQGQRLPCPTSVTIDEFEKRIIVSNSFFYIFNIVLQVTVIVMQLIGDFEVRTSTKIGKIFLKNFYYFNLTYVFVFNLAGVVLDIINLWTVFNEEADDFFISTYTSFRFVCASAYLFLLLFMQGLCFKDESQPNTQHRPSTNTIPMGPPPA